MAAGPHYCLGANLAKREVKVMLAELLPGVDDIALDDSTAAGGEQWSVPGMAVPVGIGLDRLPIRYRAQRMSAAQPILTVVGGRGPGASPNWSEGLGMAT